MGTLPRLLVPVSYGFSVRYLVPTGVLARLTECFDVVVALGWDDPSLRRRLEDEGVGTCRLPAADLDHEYRMFRRRLAVVHDTRLSSPTTRIQRRQRFAQVPARDRWIMRARRGIDRFGTLRSAAAAAIESQEPDRIRTGTNVGAFEKLLASEAPDLVLSVTPYHDQDGLLLWAARASGVPTITAIISFDNPTTRERMIAPGDRVLVWNAFNRHELLRAYPDLRSEQVVITGAPQFDLHRRPDLVLEDEEWRRALALPPDRPVILYGAGPSVLVPGEDRLFGAIDQLITDGRIDGDPYLLVRRHPADVGIGAAPGVNLANGAVIEPWTMGTGSFRSWPDDTELALQMSSLAHSAVHVNVCSSMALDGAMFDRPQIGPTFLPGAGRTDRRRVSSYYDQEHWLAIRRSGGVREASDVDELARALNESLAHPERDRDGRIRMLREVLTHTDGSGCDRLVAEIILAGRIGTDA